MPPTLLLLLALSGLLVAACSGPGPDPHTPSPDPEPELQSIAKTDAQWRALLTPIQYEVARQAGTERAFTGIYWDSKAVGTYACVCCQAPLFRSDAKFDSGCGWPSFFEPLEGARLMESEDLSIGMRRIEVRCRRCDAHLGHVFPDGPEPTGLRYCINSASLTLVEDDGPGD